MNKLTRSLMWAALLCCALQARQVFLSPSVSTTMGDGTGAKPFKSLQEVCAVAQPADTVYLLGGDYSSCEFSDVSFTKSGTAQNPILIASFPGQTVRFTGTCDDWIGHLRFSGVSHVTVQGPMEFINGSRAITVEKCTGVQFKKISIVNHSAERAMNVSKTSDFLIEEFSAINAVNGCGLWIEGSKRGALRDFKIAQTQWWGLMLRYDTSMVIEDGEVTGACLRNKGHSMGGGGWDPAIGATGYDMTFRRNFIHENWGEGLITFYRKGAIEDNILRNNWSVHLYVDYGYDLTIERNIIYSNDPAYNWQEIYGPATGIMLAQEGSKHDDAIEKIRICNNLISGCGAGITTWMTYYRDIDIMHNVIYNPVTFAIGSDGLPGDAIAVSDIMVKNNIIYKPTVDKFNTGYLRIHQDQIAAWTFSHNLWVDGIPLKGTHASSTTGDPGFVNPTASGDVAGFKLRPGSACIGSGTPVSEVTTDFWGARRSASAPSIGLHEFGGATVTGPAAMPSRQVSRNPAASLTVIPGFGVLPMDRTGRYFSVQGRGMQEVKTLRPLIGCGRALE